MAALDHHLEAVGRELRERGRIAYPVAAMVAIDALALENDIQKSRLSAHPGLGPLFGPGMSPDRLGACLWQIFVYVEASSTYGTIADGLEQIKLSRAAALIREVEKARTSDPNRFLRFAMHLLESEWRGAENAKAHLQAHARTVFREHEQFDDKRGELFETTLIRHLFATRKNAAEFPFALGADLGAATLKEGMASQLRWAVEHPETTKIAPLLSDADGAFIHGYTDPTRAKPLSTTLFSVIELAIPHGHRQIHEGLTVSLEHSARFLDALDLATRE